MPSRSISHEQKIQPVATGPKPPLANAFDAAPQLHRTGLSLHAQYLVSGKFTQCKSEPIFAGLLFI